MVGWWGMPCIYRARELFALYIQRARWQSVLYISDSGHSNRHCLSLNFNVGVTACHRLA
jgi:hypothetical protein